jgi:hypothetical protein
MPEIKVNFDPKIIMDSVIYKYVLLYVFVLQIIASQTKEDSIYKNIILRLVVNFLVITQLGLPLLEGLLSSLILTTILFMAAEK